jgi:hypothetical protein
MHGFESDGVEMPKKRHKAEEIVAKLRQVEGKHPVKTAYQSLSAQAA